MDQETAKQVKKAVPTADEMRQIVKKADKQNAKREDVQALRDLFEQIPGLASAFLPFVEGTYDATIDNLAGTPAAREMIRAQCHQQRDALGYAKSSVIEKLLIDAVVLAWLRYQLVERGAASIWGGSHNQASGEYWDKRLSAAQRRYLRAIETLARVRKMGPAVLQVNIAQQQIVNPPG